MAYTALTDAETATGAPVTQTLWRKVKDNFSYLLSGIATSGVSAVVLNGSFEIDSNADGIPDTWTRSLYAGGSSQLNTSGPMHGSKMVALIHPGGAGNGGGYFESDYVLMSELHPRWIGWLMYSSAAGMKNEVLVRAFDKDLTEIGSGTAIYSSTANPTTPTYCIRQYTPPANARFIKLRMIGGKSDTNVAGTTYFDDVTVNPFTGFPGAFTIAEQTSTSATFVDIGSATIMLPNLGAVMMQLSFAASVKTVALPTAYQRFRVGPHYTGALSTGSESYVESIYTLTGLVDTSAAVIIYQQLMCDGGSSGAYGKKDVSQSIVGVGL
jgi:hypothetical protein